MKTKILLLFIIMATILGCQDPFAKRNCDMNEAEPAEDLCVIVSFLFMTESEIDTPAEIRNRDTAIALACSAAIAAREKCSK